MISLEKLKILTPLQKLPQNVGDLGQTNCCPKSNKSSNLVTLPTTFLQVILETIVHSFGSFTSMSSLLFTLQN